MPAPITAKKLSMVLFSGPVDKLRAASVITLGSGGDGHGGPVFWGLMAFNNARSRLVPTEVVATNWIRRTH